MSFPNDPSTGSGVSNSDSPMALIEGDDVVTLPLVSSTPFRNDTITDATLDAKLTEHRAKMLASMKDSVYSHNMLSRN
jgi:hypothetical protein